jgi:dinuclear metal center YbgI/SA1388 family protein
MSTTVQTVVDALEGIAPSRLCLGNDPRGLLLGDPASPVASIGVALDITTEVVEAAVRHGHTMLVAHHPLIYYPVKTLRTSDPFPAPVVARCLRSDIAVACAHTNWDVASGGVNDVLAELLGMVDTRPLRITADTELTMIVVFVPVDHAETVRQALFAAGAGAIGNYDECAFNLRGTGMFRPLAGSNPTLGSHGIRESVDEVRIECIAPANLAGAIVESARKAHPYEEMAHFVAPLVNRVDKLGLGRIGGLCSPANANDFLSAVGRALGTTTVRSSGVNRIVHKVAVCGGAGAELVADAVTAGADALVTSDVRHHEMVDARERGFLLIDAGHAETETPGSRELARRLRSALPNINVVFHNPDGTPAPV